MSFVLFLTLLVCFCGYALARGGAPERVGAALQFAAFGVGLSLHRSLDALGYRTAILGTATIDVVLLAALVLLAWRSTRYWPLWIAGWQFATVVAHLAKLLNPDMLPLGYAIQAQIWAYPMAITTGIGAWRHRARLAAGRADPAWKGAVA